MNSHEYMQRQAMVTLANKIEADFIATHGGLATYLLASARNEASTALMALADVDPTDSKEITRLQNEVKRFRDMAEWMSKAVELGDEAWNELEEGDRAALTRIVNPQEIED